MEIATEGATAALKPDFAEQKSCERVGFYRKLPPPRIINSDFHLVIENLRHLLLLPMISGSRGEDFNPYWYSKKGWT